MTHKGTVTLETERLILRRFTVDDAEAMFRNWASDPDVVRYMPYDPCDTIEATRKHINQWFRYFDEPGARELFAIVLKTTGEVIGTIDYAELDLDARSAEVGYQLGKPWWGAGYAAEALRRVIAYCFEELKLNRVWANHDTRNGASGRVMQKSGMLYEGTFRQCNLRRGELVSRSHYAILADDYFGRTKKEVNIIPYDPKYRDDMLFCYLAAKDAISSYAPTEWSKPTLRDDLLDVNRNYLERGEAFYLAVDEHDRVVGMVGTQTDSRGDLWLKRLFIKPEHKGKGIGSKLLAAVQQYAAQKGVTSIHTRFADWYREAAAFYPAKGFVEAEPDCHLRHMVLHLDSVGQDAR